VTTPAPPLEALERRLRLDLKPRHLQLLVALDEYRSLAKVAGAIHITQPAVSKSLAEIERMLDVSLFERGPRGLTPTVYGECVVRHARSLLTGFRRARDELLALRTGGSGTVTVAMLPTATMRLVPRAVLRLKERAPGSTVVLREGTIHDMLAELRGERVDVIVGALPRDIREPGLQSLVLLEEDPVVCVAGRHHPLAGQDALEWTALAPFPWIFPPETTAVRLPLEGWLEQQGLSLPVDRIESVSIATNLTLLQESPSIAFMSRDNAQHLAAQGLITILPLELRDVSGPVGALWLRNRSMTAAMRGLLDALEEVASQARGS
jgi:DNA-binding transcriptional LysR family regulator